MIKQPKQFKAPWFSTRQQSREQHDQRRGTATSRGYGVEWQRARLQHLSVNPLCVCCLANGVVEPATMVDHVIPHKGNMNVFWNSADWQSLCDWCHKAIKASVEHSWINGKAVKASLRLNRKHPDWRARSER
jgi:5-methylcytosine-specific restriction enzyme A